MCYYTISHFFFFFSGSSSSWYSLTTCWMVYMISVGLGGAVRLVTPWHFSIFSILTFIFSHNDLSSTRVSNELGAGNPQGARLAVCVAAVIATLEGVIVGITTILVRHIWGKLYSNEEEVIAYVARIMPLLALSDFLDGFQCVLSGADWRNHCESW